MADYDYDKVFTCSEDRIQSFCVEHENGSIHDFPYAYASYSYLSPDNTAIKIKHSYCDILICGTKLAELFNSIRCRELDTIKIGGEIENEKGKLVSVRSVYYEGINRSGSGEENFKNNKQAKNKSGSIGSI